jgi:hypothetical protein
MTNTARLEWDIHRVVHLADRIRWTAANTKANNTQKAGDIHYEVQFGSTVDRTDAVAFRPLTSLGEAGEGVTIADRLRLALASDPKTVAELAADLDLSADTLRRTLTRSSDSFHVVPDTHPQRWTTTPPDQFTGTDLPDPL